MKRFLIALCISIVGLSAVDTSEAIRPSRKDYGGEGRGRYLMSPTQCRMRCSGFFCNNHRTMELCMALCPLQKILKCLTRQDNEYIARKICEDETELALKLDKKGFDFTDLTVNIDNACQYNEKMLKRHRKAPSRRFSRSRRGSEYLRDEEHAHHTNEGNNRRSRSHSSRSRR